MIFIPKNLKEIRIHLKDPLFKNSYFILLTSGSINIFGFIFWIVIARFYSPYNVGLASAIFSVSQLIVIFASMGLNFSLVRYFTQRYDKNELVNTVIFTNGGIVLLLTMVFIVGLKLWSPALISIQENYSLLLSFTILTVLSAVFSLQGYVFIAARYAKFSFYQNIIYNILRVFLPIFFLSFGLLGIISSWTLAMIIAFFLGSFWLIPKVLPNYKLRLKISKLILKEIIPYSFGNYISAALGSLLIQLMPLMIVNVLNVENAAYYYIAWSIASILITITGAVTTSLFAEGSQDQEVKLRSNLLKSIKFCFFLLIPATILLFIFSNRILLIFGQIYSENATELLWLLALGCIPQMINEIYITLKRIQMDIRPMIYVNLAIAILVISGSYFLINIIGLIGVGIAWVFGQGIISIPIGVLLWKKNNHRNLKNM